MYSSSLFHRRNALRSSFANANARVRQASTRSANARRLNARSANALVTFHRVFLARSRARSRSTWTVYNSANARSTSV